ncbi:hypothetical protein BCR44DRAFT_1422676 [Catenaria anguillulae PL171]|uniref:Uncharacterized protein n=1 Tax=Catenaria anguillulae PL171 TaxID=765915 RepID=A0A1Y2I5L6_9FUNG|nr:hypothetical protein BCR44DRAFT_1422676 [Catenaria anguillulae PL171]
MPTRPSSTVLVLCRPRARTPPSTRSPRVWLTGLAPTKLLFQRCACMCFKTTVVNVVCETECLVCSFNLPMVPAVCSAIKLFCDMYKSVCASGRSWL